MQKKASVPRGTPGRQRETNLFKSDLQQEQRQHSHSARPKGRHFVTRLPAEVIFKTLTPTIFDIQANTPIGRGTAILVLKLS